MTKTQRNKIMYMHVCVCAYTWMWLCVHAHECDCVCTHVCMCMRASLPRHSVIVVDECHHHASSVLHFQFFIKSLRKIILLRNRLGRQQKRHPAVQNLILQILSDLFSLIAKNFSHFSFWKGVEYNMKLNVWFNMIKMFSWVYKLH